MDDVSERLSKAITSLLFVLDLEQPAEAERSNDKIRKHVMLSYNWEVQHVMLKVNELENFEMVDGNFSIRLPNENVFAVSVHDLKGRYTF